MTDKEREKFRKQYDENKKRVMGILECTSLEYEKMADYGYIDHFGMAHCDTKETFKQHMTAMIGEEEVMEQEMGESLWKRGDKNVLLGFLWK